MDVLFFDIYMYYCYECNGIAYGYFNNYINHFEMCSFSIHIFFIFLYSTYNSKDVVLFSGRDTCHKYIFSLFKLHRKDTFLNMLIDISWHHKDKKEVEEEEEENVLIIYSFTCWLPVLLTRLLICFLSYLLASLFAFCLGYLRSYLL